MKSTRGQKACKLKVEGNQKAGPMLGLLTFLGSLRAQRSVWWGHVVSQWDTWTCRAGASVPVSVWGYPCGNGLEMGRRWGCHHVLRRSAPRTVGEGFLEEVAFFFQADPESSTELLKSLLYSPLLSHRAPIFHLIFLWRVFCPRKN